MSDQQQDGQLSLDEALSSTIPILRAEATDQDMPPAVPLGTPDSAIDIAQMIAWARSGDKIQFTAFSDLETLTGFRKMIAEKPAVGPHGYDVLEFQSNIKLTGAELTLPVGPDGQPQKALSVGDATMTEREILHGVFVGTDRGLVFHLPPHAFAFDLLADAEPDTVTAWRELCEALDLRNKEKGFDLPVVDLPPIPTTQEMTAKRPRIRIPRSSIGPLESTLLFGSNTINHAAVRALSRPDIWQTGDEKAAFVRSHKQKLKNLDIEVGLPNKLESNLQKELWTFLSRGGVPMVKAHYALWGRWYQDGGNPGQYVMMNVNQFCGDLGYKKHPSGGYRAEHKREAVSVLRAITTLEIRATYTPPTSEGKKGLAHRLRGPLWNRGIEHETSDNYGDLFGVAREGNKAEWEITDFTYAPGPWFNAPEYSKYNRAVGKIGVGLLALSNNTDQWAILIGGYLGTLIRVNAYATRTLVIRTILDSIGAAQGDDGRRRESHYRDKLERAMDRLRSVAVIEDWTWGGVDTTEVDMDDAEAIAEYGAKDVTPRGDWRKQTVKITWPKDRDADRKRITDRQSSAIKKSVDSAKRRSAARKAVAGIPSDYPT